MIDSLITVYFATFFGAIALLVGAAILVKHGWFILPLGAVALLYALH